MSTRPLVLCALVVVALGAGYWSVTRGAASPQPREAPKLEAGFEADAGEAPPEAGLQIPEAPPRLQDVAIAGAKPKESPQESPPASAPPLPSPVPEFEAKYAAKTLEELRAAEERLSKLVAAATQARFKELEPRFEDLLAKGEYGARVFAPGEAAHADLDVSKSPRSSWFFQGKRLDGTDESRYLDFDPTTEFATAALVAESIWVQARIAESAAKH